MGSQIIFAGELIAWRNEGERGGALHVGDFGQCTLEKVVQYDVQNNTASRDGCAFYADLDSSAAAIDELLYMVGREANSKDICPYPFPEKVVKTRINDPVMEFFRKNSACNAAHTSAALHAASFRSCARLFKLMAVIWNQTNFTHSPSCMPYPAAMWSHAEELRPWCPLNNDSRALVNHSHADCKLTLGEALDFYDNSSFEVCYSPCQRLAIFNKNDLYHKEVSTNPAWIFFLNTTVECMKTIGDRVWYFYKNCSRQYIYEFTVKKAKRYKLPATDCALYNLALAYHRYRTSATGVLPGYPFVLTPWAGSIRTWRSFIYLLQIRNVTEDHHDELEGTRRGCSPVLPSEDWRGTELPLDSISDLVLRPAPGEEFNLVLAVTDEMMNHKTASLVVQVETVNRDVLLGHNRIQLGLNETILFSSYRQLRSIFLAGIPGAEGWLAIWVESSYNMRQHGHRKLVLRLNFRLRDCYLGFDPPNKNNPAEAARYAKEYSVNRMEQILRQEVPEQNVKESPLVCRCKSYLAGVSHCSGGRKVFIKSSYWAGNLYDNNIPEPHERKEPLDLNKETLSGGKLQDTEKRLFATALCSNGLCSRHGGGKYWLLNEESPCREGLQRTGVLCGTCRPGTRWNLGEEGCRNCTGKYQISTAWFVLALITVNVFFFILLLAFNIGLTPTLDSWLFFIQAIYFSLPQDKTLTAYIFTIITLGLGRACLKDALSTPHQHLLILLQSMVFFSLLFVLWFAARFRQCFRVMHFLQQRRFLVHTLWLVIVYSYTTLAYSSLTFLTCIPVRNRWVLYIDGSIVCFKGTHTPYGVVSIVIFAVFIVPPCLLCGWRRVQFMPRFKELMDEATDMYEDTHRWYVSMNMFRRLAVAVLVAMAAVVDSHVKGLCLAIFFILLTIFHTIVRPLRRNFSIWRVSDVDNKYEVFLLTILSIIAVLNLFTTTEVDMAHADRIRKSFTYLQVIPTVSGLIFALMRHFYNRWQQKKQQSVKDPESEHPGKASYLERLWTGRNRLLALFKQNGKDSGLFLPLIPQNETCEMTELITYSQPVNSPEPVYYRTEDGSQVGGH